MAQGTWEDFTDKYGFAEGGQLEDRDFDARKVLVKLLNEQPEMKEAKLRALEFDRTGVHNSCLIVISPAVEGKSDKELLEDYFKSEEPEPELPDAIADEIGELVAEAYSKASEQN